MDIKLLSWYLASTVLKVGAISVLAVAFRWTWNSTISSIFDYKEISYAQALSFCFVFDFMFLLFCS